MINLTCLPHLSVSAISVDEGRRFADKWFGPEHGLSSAASRHPASVHRHAVIDTKGSRVPASNQSERKGVDQLQAIPYSLFRQGTEGGWVPCLDFEQPADLASLIIYRTNYIFFVSKKAPAKAAHLLQVGKEIHADVSGYRRNNRLTSQCTLCIVWIQYRCVGNPATRAGSGG